MSEPNEVRLKFARNVGTLFLVEVAVLCRSGTRPGWAVPSDASPLDLHVLAGWDGCGA